MSDSPAAPLGRILAIDDDRDLLENFSLCLESSGYRVHAASNLQEGMKLAASQPFHVCLLDRSIGAESGMDALPRLRELAPQMRVIMVTAHSRVDDAVRAIADGAADYLVKPCSPEQLRVAVARQMETRRMLEKLERLEREGPRERAAPTSRNPAMARLLALAEQVARTDANILLLGESGTGKGVLANALHDWSPRAAPTCASSPPPTATSMRWFGKTASASTCSIA